MTGASAGFKQNLYRFPLGMSVQLIDPAAHMQALLYIEQACFPPEMRDARADMVEFFSEPRATGLILYKGIEVIGAMLGTRVTKENSPGIFEMYPDIEARQDATFYLDSVSIIESHRAPIVFDFLIHETAVLLKRRGYELLTGHARRKRGYSRLLQRRYGVEVLHTYDNWHGFNEPFDYIRKTVAGFPTVPRPIHAPLTALREWRRRRLYGRALSNA